MKTKEVWDPFGYTLKWVVKVEVENCKCAGIVYKATYRDWEKEDYINKEVMVKVGHSECKGIITEMYVEREKTKKELEYDKLVEKWQ